MNIKNIFLALLFLIFSSTTTFAYSSYQFEFFDFQTNASVATFPFGHTNEVIVASQTQDVRNQLPINLSLKIDGNEKWTATIANIPTKTCRGATGCSTHGPILSDPGTSSYVELTAKDKNGQTIATYTHGTLDKNTPVAMTQTSQTNQPMATRTQSQTPFNLSSTWFQQWWQFGFWVGILWLFPWVFVGWQWTKFKFWGFGWPWPWWFWIPLFWFIPWLFIAWWWLVWWAWWVWVWWLFPWVFWLFWWIIIFKEAIIWLWRQDK